MRLDLVLGSINRGGVRGLFCLPRLWLYSAVPRSEPFCSAFGDKDGGDYAEATQLHINSQQIFKVVANLRLNGISEDERFQKHRKKRVW